MNFAYVPILFRSTFAHASGPSDAMLKNNAIEGYTQVR